MKQEHSAETVLVTGGGGFLGQYICRALQQAGYRPLSFNRQHYPELADAGIAQVQGDLCDAASVERAVSASSAIIHTAAKAGVWGSPASYYAPNVEGTRLLLAAAARHKIKRFVYTSSPSVVFDGNDIEGGDESLPYATHFMSSYPYTKRLAEEEVLAAHGRHGMAVVALRPHLIWGPHDPHFLPRLAAKAQRGQLRVIGQRRNLVDVIYVENAATAHVQALQTLSLSAPHAGKAYFLGQDEPVALWDFLDELLAAMQLPPISGRLPYPLAYGAGAACEWAYRLSRRASEPPLTRFVVLQLAKSHYFSHAAARRDFGYQPKISTSEGLKRLAAYCLSRRP